MSRKIGVPLTAYGRRRKLGELAAPRPRFPELLLSLPGTARAAISSLTLITLPDGFSDLLLGKLALEGRLAGKAAVSTGREWLGAE